MRLRRGWQLPCKLWRKSVGRVFSPVRWNITHLWLFWLSFPVLHIMSLFCRFCAQVEHCWTDFHVSWLKRRDSAQGNTFGGYNDRWRHLGKMCPQNPQTWAWIGNFKPKCQNMKIDLSPEVLIQSSRNLKIKQRPPLSLRGWAIIALNQIQHGWRPPSWKLLWRHNSAADDPISMQFGVPIENHMSMAVKRSKSKPEVEFQYGGRLFPETGSSSILAVEWDMWSKFGMSTALNFPKCPSWPNRKPEIDLQRYGRHLVKSIWHHNFVVDHRIA